MGDDLESFLDQSQAQAMKSAQLAGDSAETPGLGEGVSATWQTEGEQTDVQAIQAGDQPGSATNSESVEIPKLAGDSAVTQGLGGGVSATQQTEGVHTDVQAIQAGDQPESATNLGSDDTPKETNVACFEEKPDSLQKEEKEGETNLTSDSPKLAEEVAKSENTALGQSQEASDVIQREPKPTDEISNNQDQELSVDSVQGEESKLATAEVSGKVSGEVSEAKDPGSEEKQGDVGLEDKTKSTSQESSPEDDGIQNRREEIGKLGLDLKIKEKAEEIKALQEKLAKAQYVLKWRKTETYKDTLTAAKQANEVSFRFQVHALWCLKVWSLKASTLKSYRFSGKNDRSTFFHNTVYN